MKSIENKTTQIKNAEGFMTYADLIKIVCEQPLQGGYSMTDIEQRLAIKKACDKAEATIEIEDLRLAYLKSICATSKWGAVHEDLLLFGEYIKELK